ncbi:MAG: hypothetical protein ACLGI6_16880 [Gammaproteobacteria bacterium]
MPVSAAEGAQVRVELLDAGGGVAPIGQHAERVDRQQLQVLVVQDAGKAQRQSREARGEGKYRRNYEVVSLDSLAIQRQSGDPSTLGPFQRWQDPGWKRMTPSLR